jgi:transposase InsO family protein
MKLRSGEKNIRKRAKNVQKRSKTSVIDQQVAKELHRRVVKKFKTRRIIVKGIDHIWAADLLIMTRYSRENRGYKYILNVIDCFSKYVWCVALKKKTGDEVSDAFQQILKKSGGRKPEKLHTDRGKEFVNATFKKLLARYDIEMYHTFSEVKSSIIERFNRTLNEKLKLRFEVNRNFKWLQVLPSILREYNEKNIHRTIGVPPVLVTKKNEKEIYERMYSLKKFALEKPIFKVGDRVRITCRKDTFGNKYGRNWTTEIFLINKIRFTDPITYEIADVDGEKIYGHFYREELQRTKF